MLYVWVLGITLETEVVAWLLKTEKSIHENAYENPSEEEDPPRLGSFEFKSVPYES
jgi:hypothetical protein